MSEKKENIGKNTVDPFLKDLKKNKNLYTLSQINRIIGLRVLIVASLIAPLSSGLSLIPEIISLNLPLNTFSLVMLILMILFVALIELNLSWLYKYIEHLLLSKRQSKWGLPYESLSGVKSILNKLKRDIRLVFILLISSIPSIVIFLLGVLGIATFLYLSLTSAIIIFGYINISQRPLNPDEILEKYQPDVHPTVIGSHNLLETFIDPFNWLKLDDYKREALTYLKKGVSIDRAVSKTSLLLYYYLTTEGKAIGSSNIDSEVCEMLEDKKNLSAIKQHKFFNFEMQKGILSKVKNQIPEFTYLIDRLLLVLVDNLPELKKDYYPCHIDAEASLEKRKGEVCNVFVLLYNNQKDSCKLSISYSAPAFSPNSNEVSTTLPARNFDLPEENSLPTYIENSDKDIVELMSNIMEKTQFIWFSLDTKEIGVNPVIVSVKKQDGSVIFGKTFRVETHHDTNGLLLSMLPTLNIVLGIFVYLFSLVKQLF